MLDAPKGVEEDGPPKADVVEDPKRDGAEEAVPKGVDEEVAPKGELNAEPDEDANVLPPNPGGLLPKGLEDDVAEKGFAADA